MNYKQNRILVLSIGDSENGESIMNYSLELETKNTVTNLDTENMFSIYQIK